MNIPTNVEIILNEELEDKILIPIPRTKFAILGQLTKEKKWNIAIISKIGSVKKYIGKEISDEKFNVLIQKTLAFGELRRFKDEKRKIAEVINYYKSLLKQE